jgi:hypothetical protein
MKTYPSHGAASDRRSLMDPRSSSSVPAPQTRQTLLNDRRSTR